MDREMGVAGRCLGLLHHLFKGLAFEPAAVFAEMSVGLELRAVSSRVGAIIFVHCPTPTLAVYPRRGFTRGPPTAVSWPSSCTVRVEGGGHIDGEIGLVQEAAGCGALRRPQGSGAFAAALPIVQVPARCGGYPVVTIKPRQH